MPNVFDYVREERRPLTDSEAPFNEVDALVFAALSYEDVASLCPTLSLDEDRDRSFSARLRAFQPRHPWLWLKGFVREPFDSVTLREAGERRRALEAEGASPSARMVSLADPDQTSRFFAQAAASPRFAEARVGAVAEHVNRGEQTQFTAMTFMLPDGGRRGGDPTRGGTLLIAFRGTDDSLVGWKEDFNMAFQYPVPAQRAASAYLDMVARLWHGPIVLTGHSKGGNLAVYAAMNASPEVARRIRHVYSLDGPGFPSSVVRSRQYVELQPKVTKIVPSSSIVGQVFETPERCRVVVSDSTGIMQHFLYSWQVSGGAFVTEPDVDSRSRLFSESLNRWMESLTVEQRERAVDALFEVLHAGGATSISEVLAGFPGSVPAMLGSMLGLSAQDRRHILEALGILFRATVAAPPRR